MPGGTTSDVFATNYEAPTSTATGTVGNRPSPVQIQAVCIKSSIISGASTVPVHGFRPCHWAVRYAFFLHNTHPADLEMLKRSTSQETDPIIASILTKQGYSIDYVKHVPFIEPKDA